MVVTEIPKYQHQRMMLQVQRRLALGALGIACLVPGIASSQACFATPTSMTPPSWTVAVAGPTPGAPTSVFRAVADYPLPGPANRFDYQSIDITSGRLYMNHMNAGRTVVFDLNASKVIGEIAGVPRATGVWAVPEHHKVFISAAGNHEVVIVDDRTLAVVARIGGIRFPDGIAYARESNKVFVSNEVGDADVVIDARTNVKRSTIPLGGEAGNTHYDSVSHCILVAVQTRNQLVAIDAASEKVLARYDLPGSDYPHGFTLDEPGRLAFVTGEGNSKLQVIDLRTMKIVGTHAVGRAPDVLAWDPGWRRLYVASEGGVVTVFQADSHSLRSIGEYRAPHAHTVAVDPRTHRIYLPLESVNGRPVLRVLIP